MGNFRSQARQQRALTAAMVSTDDAGGRLLVQDHSRSRQQRAQVNESTLGQPEHASSSGSATADVDVMRRDSAQILSPDGARGSPGCLTVQCAGCKCKSNKRTTHTCKKRRVFKRGRPDGQGVSRQTHVRSLATESSKPKQHQTASTRIRTQLSLFQSGLR